MSFVVIWPAEFEEQRFARTERTESDARAGLPKVDLVKLTGAAQTLEPITVGDRDECRYLARHDKSSTK